MNVKITQFQQLMKTCQTTQLWQTMNLSKADETPKLKFSQNSITFIKPQHLIWPITFGGMKSCRLRAISCQVTQKLERVTTLE